jgi:nucleolysin TIA-1/TIAR
MGGGGDKSGIMSPSSGGPFGRRSAPEPNKRALYVGGLDPRVTEDVLRQIFETTGHVQSVKIIPDKNVSAAPIVRSAPLSFRFVCDTSADRLG